MAKEKTTSPPAAEPQTVRLSLAKAFELGVEHHQAGRFAQAEQIYRQILAAKPDHADSLHLLGVLIHQQGKNVEGLALIDRAIAVDPRQVAYHSNRGVTLRSLGRRDEAAAALRQAIQVDPSYAAAYKNLATVLNELERFQEAVAALGKLSELAPADVSTWRLLGVSLARLNRRADAIAAFETVLRLRPDDVETLNNYSIVLREGGRPAEALAASERARRAKPENSEAWNNYGLALGDLGRREEAIAALRKSTQLDPKNVFAWNNLGVAFKNLGKQSEALTALQTALSLDPHYAGALNNVGELLNQLNRPREAETRLRRAIELLPSCFEAYNNLGLSLKELERQDESIAALVKSLEINPNYVPALINYGNALVAKGDDRGGAEQFFRAVTLEPNSVAGWYALASSGKHKFTDEERAQIETLLARPSTSPDDVGLLNFALAAIHDKIGPPEKAFEHARLANARRKEANRGRGQDYDPAKHVLLVDRLIEVFTPEFIASFAGFGNPDVRPAFVVGMPRSSTTLVEQITSSHPQVFGAGELNDLLQIVADLPQNLGSALPYPLCLREVDRGILRKVADDHLARLASLGADATRIVDKMTINFLHLGLIAILYPNAKIIHCQRDPRDTCLSCFMHNFAAAGMHFTFSLEDLGHYYRQYLRIMEHWRKVMPGPILDMPYEELVHNQEALSRRMIEHLGLEWDERCLAFHENQRMVKTASNLQVRQPMNTKSLGRWKKYEAELAPLLAILETA